MSGRSVEEKDAVKILTKMPFFCCSLGERRRPDSRRFTIGGMCKLSSPSETEDESEVAPSFSEEGVDEISGAEAPLFTGADNPAVGNNLPAPWSFIERLLPRIFG
jgi:hypothetical protein